MATRGGQPADDPVYAALSIELAQELRERVAMGRRLTF
jgi:hypothetical protein